MESQLDGLIAKAREAARGEDTQVIMTGILPTMEKGDVGLHNQTPNPRYKLLNDTMSELRGDAYEINIKGADEIIVKHDSVMLESANTSFQIHFQVSPGEFARLYNIAQAVCAPVLAIAANSPLLFGKRLWHETRIALFQQSTDTRRSSHLREQQPRVSFGSRWVHDSVIEIFQEDIARFRVLFAADVEGGDPLEELEQGTTPHLGALRLHNSTVYRWNRPCYGVSPEGLAHLRIENRVLPSGPTLLDQMANAAFWFGLMSGVLEEHGDITRHMDFDEAQSNFVAAARHGLGAPITWIDGTSQPAHKLIAERLLPLAREGLREGGIAEDDISRYLDVIEGRVTTRVTGSTWLLRSYAALKTDHTRAEALSALCAATIRNQEEGSPVHTWETLDHIRDAASWKDNHQRVSQYMSRDIITLHEDEPIEFAASLMTWHGLHFIPVEDHDHHLVGMITHDLLLQLFADPTCDKEELGEMTVHQVMLCDIPTIGTDTLTQDALTIMYNHQTSCLPVVEEGCLVGIVTERDVMKIARQLLEERLNDDTQP